jgi:hypothetical protein
LPLLASARATWEFFSERVELQSWGANAQGLVPVEVEIEVPAPAPAAGPENPPALRTSGD